MLNIESPSRFPLRILRLSGDSVTFFIMHIKAAKPEDAERLTEIAFAAKRHWGYPELWMESWRDLLTVSPEFIQSHETFLAVINGQSVGFYALGRNNGRADLLHLWVLPGWMGKGIGRSLFQHAIGRTKALGFRELEIESDPNAEGFYRRLGARRVDVRLHTLEQQRRELPVLIFEVENLRHADPIISSR
jgi:GNAT superfamily N-acetyltransferase